MKRLGLVTIIVASVGCGTTHLIVLGEPGLCEIDPLSGKQSCIPLLSVLGAAKSPRAQVVDPADGPSIYERSTLLSYPAPAAPPPVQEISPQATPLVSAKVVQLKPQRISPTPPAGPVTLTPPVGAVAPKLQQWGYFKIDSVVPVEVLVDGWKKPLSNDKVRLKLSPGPHVITVIFPNGKKITIKRKIKAGKTIRLSLAYEDSLQ